MFGAQVGCGRRGFVARPSRIGFLDRPQGVCLETPVPDAGVRSQQEDGGCTVATIQYLYIIVHTCSYIAHVQGTTFERSKVQGFDFGEVQRQA